MTAAAAATEPLGALLTQVLGDCSDPEFDAITLALARISGCRLSFLSIVHGDQLWFKSTSDGRIAAVDLERSFCSGVLRIGRTTLIEDAALDPRFAGNAFVIGDPFIRFYAGMPLRVQGQLVGTLCIIDPEPRRHADDVLVHLSGLGQVVEALLEARLAAARAVEDADRLAKALTSRDRMHCQLLQAEHMAGIGSWRLTVADGRLEYSDQIYAIHDLPVGEPGALADALRFYPDADRRIIQAAVERAIAEGVPYDLELDFVTATGRLRRVRAMGRPESDAGEVTALVGVFQDITERHRRQKALEHEANTDALTELCGRRAFTARMEALLNGPSAGEPIALLLIDLDHFKSANDRHGHAAGDEVLRRIANALRGQWLVDSYAARLGGDEFALIVTDRDLLADLDGTVTRLLSELVVTVGPPDTQVRVTATIGVCHCWSRNVARRTLLETADAALYAAKNAKRGTAAFRRLGAAAARSA